MFEVKQSSCSAETNCNSIIDANYKALTGRDISTPTKDACCYIVKALSDF